MKEASMLRAGVSRIEITTEKVPVNDPLYAKVLVLDDSEKKIAFVSLDCVCMGGGIGELSDRFFPDLKAAMKNCGIDTLLCGTTHTHTAYPMICEESVVMERVLLATKQALASMEPVKAGSGVGQDNSFLINRTLQLKDGSYWTIRQAHPCPPDEEIAEIPYADDTIGILRVDRLDSTPLCILFTFGCHPLLGYANNAPTANFPGIAERLIEDQTGATAIMFQSCGGDVTEIDYKNFDKPKNCEAPGISLGLAVLKALPAIKTKENVAMTCLLQPVTFPRRLDISREVEALEAERDRLVGTLGSCPLNFKTFLPLYLKYMISPEYPLDYAYAYKKEEALGITQLKDQDKINRKNIAKYLENMKTMEKLSKIAATLSTLKWHQRHNLASGETTIDSEVLGVRIGDCILITAPVEPLSEIGRRIRESASMEKVFVVGYANGYMHYGAPAKDYNNGGYETIECMLEEPWQEIYEKTAQSIILHLQSEERN